MVFTKYISDEVVLDKIVHSPTMARRRIAYLEKQLFNNRAAFINEYVLNRSKTHTCLDGEKETLQAIKAWNTFNPEEQNS